MRRPLISGITSGTFGSMRNADELSITTAPAFTAAGANLRDAELPAENSAISTPSKERSVSSSTTTVWPRKLTGLPAERALASALSLLMRKSRRFVVAMNSAPTAPVTPAMATTGSFFTFSPSGFWISDNKKAPTLRTGRSDQTVRFDRLRAHASRGPEGLGFGRAFRGRDHGAELMRESGKGVNPLLRANSRSARLNHTA